MDLQQLKYFQTVAKLEHMSLAANELHIAQPTLSKMISRLEEQLEVSLFDRQGRRIKLNTYGKAFLNTVDKVFSALEEGEQELKRIRGLQRERISIALNIPSLLPALMEGFLSRHPQISITHEIGANQEMLRKLENNEINFSICSPPIEGENIECIPLLVEEIFLVVPRDHSLAGRNSIRLSEVENEPFISFKKGYGLRELTDSFCRQAGFVPNIIYEGSVTTEEPKALVSSRLGIALLPPIHKWSSPFVSYPVFIHVQEPVCTRTIGLSYVRNRHLPEAARQFISYVVDYFKE